MSCWTNPSSFITLHFLVNIFTGMQFAMLQMQHKRQFSPTIPPSLSRLYSWVNRPNYTVQALKPQQEDSSAAPLCVENHTLHRDASDISLTMLRVLVTWGPWKRNARWCRVKVVLPRDRPVITTLLSHNPLKFPLPCASLGVLSCPVVSVVP